MTTFSGWVFTALDEARSDLALSESPFFLPDFLRQPYPLSARDTMKLRMKMSARYREWTGGRNLLDDLAQERTRAEEMFGPANDNPTEEALAGSLGSAPGG